MVRAINPTRIIDKVGIDGATIETEFDTAQLRHTQVTALTYYAAAQITAINAQGIVGLVAYIGVRLTATFDVGADAAIPDQVDRRFEQLMNQLGRRQLLGLDVEQLPHLRRQRDLLETAGKETATLRNQAGVIVGPA